MGILKFINPFNKFEPNPDGPRFIIHKRYQVDISLPQYDEKRPFRILSYLQNRRLLKKGMLRRPRPVSLKRLALVHGTEYLHALEKPGAEGMENWSGSGSLRWNANQHISLTLGLGVSNNHSDNQSMGNYANDDSQDGVTGIGGVDYVFGTLDQTTIDMTLRANILINRDQSIQLYAQPYSTSGDYTNPRWLAEPDSYDLRPYAMDASQEDFLYTSINLNLVYRYEYRPGSTIYLVWAHGKTRYDERGWASNPHSWNNQMDFSDPFKTEPENTVMAKVSYWFSI